MPPSHSSGCVKTVVSSQRRGPVCVVMVDGPLVMVEEEEDDDVVVVVVVVTDDELEP